MGFLAFADKHEFTAGIYLVIVCATLLLTVLALKNTRLW